MTCRSVSCKAAFSAGLAARLSIDTDHVLDRLLLFGISCGKVPRRCGCSCSGSREDLAGFLVVVEVVVVMEMSLSDFLSAFLSAGLLHFVRSWDDAGWIRFGAELLKP